MPRDLLILRGADRLRWGGDLRRRFLFEALEERPRATVVEGFARSDIRAALAPYRRRRWEVWRRGPRVVSSELLDPSLVDLLARVGAPLAVDVHDEPVLQAEALGVPLPPERARELRDRLDANLDAFRWHVVPSGSFARLAGIEPSRAIVAPNGTDTRSIEPRPVPDGPTVALVSGAAPHRGIELLVDAVRLARTRVAGTRLLLFLTATGTESAAYLDGLTRALRGERWVEIGPLGHAELGQGLGRATVLCVPHPASPYLDAALPVKLLDSMAAGRPLVVTPRTEMRAVVERADAGLVAAGDSPEDLAAPLVELLGDRERAARLGQNARRAAEREFDWRVISARLAADLGLAR